ncbi:MAG: radical SAM protein [Bacteroidota bacterium]
MKILLVAPCPPREQRPKSMDIPQLTLSLIAGMTPPEHEVEICEEVYEDVINFDGDYDVIGISIMTQTCLRGYEIANEFKKRDKTVVFGGIHATCRPHEALMYGDAVVIGEAEGGLWEQVLTDIKHNKLRELYKLDALPDLQMQNSPRKELIRCRSGKFSIAPIETTRGCPYNCDFCTVSRFFGTKQRHKKLRDIIEEAESCPQKYLFFLDDNITGDKKFARELFRELIPLNKIWVGQASINLSNDPETMKLAKKSGCGALLVGFESMTEGGLNHYRKSLKTINENVDAVKRLRDNGILTMASLIFGLDTDTDETFKYGLEFLIRSKAAFFQSCVATPYPGTPVFEKLASEGRILTDDWSKFDTTKVNIQPLNFSPERLLDGCNDIQEAIYSNSAIFKRALPNMKIGFSAALLYLTLNKGYQTRLKAKKEFGVNRNELGVPVDFDTTKYVVPVKKKVAKKIQQPELLCV